MNAPLNTDKLGKLLSLASSDNDNEALAALRMAKNLLTGAGMDFKDVAQRMAIPKAATPDFDFASAWADVSSTWHKPAAPPKPKGYTDDCGNTWASKSEHDDFRAQQRVWREAERRRYAPQRAAVLEKYGSFAAAVARDEREQALHEAALPWLQDPNSPEPGYEHLAGRWHSSMGGWKQHDFNKHPADECRAAIEAAIPMPTTIREARDEAQYWDQRSDDLCHALEYWGDEQLDLPAAYRRELVRKMYERTMPVVTLDNMHVRLQFLAASDRKDDACDATPSILDAFELLVLNANSANTSGEGIPATVAPVQSEHPVRAADRRAHVIAMLSNLDTAVWSDRTIAKAAGVAPLSRVLPGWLRVTGIAHCDLSLGLALEMGFTV